MNLSKRVGLNINRRQISSDKKYNSMLAVADQGRGLGAPDSPLIFRPNWGSKGRKKISFWALVHLLFQRLDDRPPSSYLKVCIRHRLASFSLLYAVVLPALYKFFYRKWNIRNYSVPISEIFFIFYQKNYNRNCDLWSFLFGVLRSNSQNKGAACCKAPKKGGNLGRNSQSSVLWLLIGSLTREKKHLSSFLTCGLRVAYGTRRFGSVYSGVVVLTVSEVCYWPTIRDKMPGLYGLE